MTQLKTVEQIAEYLQVCRTTIWRWMTRGHNPIPYHRPAPNVIRFDIDEVNAWLRGKKEEKAA